MKKVYYLITTLVMLFFVQNFYGQSMVVSGVVTEKGSGIPLPGVNVIIKGTSYGSVTDFDGKFVVKATAIIGKKLEFSFVGYKTMLVSLTGGAQIINVSMEEDAVSLDAVVVTALGIKRAAKALGYSLTQVKGDQLNNVKTTNAINSLQGRVAGVNISTSSSGASGSTRVIIRGASSLTGNNQPLYVVDGIPIINNTKGSVVGSTSVSFDGGDDISSINPDDIASVSILKGSSASALYGSEASNGVIIITTKTGKGQQGFGVEYSSSFSFDKVNTNLQNFQTDYGQGYQGLRPGYKYVDNAIVEITDPTEAIEHAQDYTLQSWGAKYDGSSTINWDGVKRPYTHKGNNLNKFYNTGTTAVNSIAVSNSNEQGSYRLGFSNLENKDIFPNTTLNRKSFSLGANAKINEKLSSTVNIKYIIEKTHNRVRIGDTPGNANTAPFVLPGGLDINDLKPGVNDQGTELVYQSSPWISNPYWVTNRYSNDDKKNRIIASSSLKYDINDWLFLTGRAGLDSYDLSRRLVTPVGSITPGAETGKLTQISSKYSLFDADIMLGIDKGLTDKISTNSLIGANTRKSNFESLSAVGQGFVDPNVNDIKNTTLPVPSFGFYEKKTNSVYGSFELDYDKFYYLTFTGRNDWFSTLSYPGKTTPNNEFYWSVSNSLLLDKLFEMPEEVNYAKLRASYAQVAGGARDAYSLNIDYAIIGSFQGQSFGGLNTSSTAIPNANLIPFQKSEFEIGFEGRFFENRLGVDVAYYKNNTTDDIVNASASASSGYSSAILNIGELENKGIELLIDGTPVRTDNFTWNTSFNLGYNKGTILHTDEEDTQINVDGSETRSKTATISHIVGENYGVIFGSSYERNEDGIIIYDNSGNIPVPVQGVKKILGNGVAPLTLGFSNTFKYKNFRFSFLIDAKFGGQVHSGTNRELMMRGLHKKTLEGRENGLKVSGIDSATGDVFTTVVAPKDLKTYYGFIAAETDGISEEFVYSTDYVKFREMSLSYNLPKTVLKNIFFSDLRVSVIGRNLFYISKKIDNVDPEASLNNLNSQGIERFGVPSTRSIGFSLNVKF